MLYQREIQFRASDSIRSILFDIKCQRVWSCSSAVGGRIWIHPHGINLIMTIKRDEVVVFGCILLQLTAFEGYREFCRASRLVAHLKICLRYAGMIARVVLSIQAGRASPLTYITQKSKINISAIGKGNPNRVRISISECNGRISQNQWSSCLVLRIVFFARCYCAKNYQNTEQDQYVRLHKKCFKATRQRTYLTSRLINQYDDLTIRMDLEQFEQFNFKV